MTHVRLASERLVYLISGAGLGELGALVAGRVDGQETTVHDGEPVLAGGRAQHGRGGHGGEVQVIDPLEVLHGATPGNHDVAPAKRLGSLVGGHGHVADPVGVPAPGVRERRQRQAEEGLRQGDRRRGVDEPGDLVVARAGDAGGGEEVVVAVQAGAGVRGAALRVEPVVGGLRELPVGDQRRPEVRVQRVQKVLPRRLAVELAPPGRDGTRDRCRRRGCCGSVAADDADWVWHWHCRQPAGYASDDRD